MIKSVNEKEPLFAIPVDQDYAKAIIPSKDEHLFYVVKNLFCHRKSRCKCQLKNTEYVFMVFNLVNFVIAK